MSAIERIKNRKVIPQNIEVKLSSGITFTFDRLSALHLRKADTLATKQMRAEGYEDGKLNGLPFYIAKMYAVAEVLEPHVRAWTSPDPDLEVSPTNLKLLFAEFSDDERLEIGTKYFEAAELPNMTEIEKKLHGFLLQSLSGGSATESDTTSSIKTPIAEPAPDTSGTAVESPDVGANSNAPIPDSPPLN